MHSLFSRSFFTRTVLAALASVAMFIGTVTNAAAENAPAFDVTGLSGKHYKLSELAGKNVVLEWFNSGCPFVQRVYEDGSMQKLQAEYTKKGFIWLTVNSTEESHKDFLDAAKAKSTLDKWKAVPTDYITDKDGVVGQAYGAKTTPHMFLIGTKGELLYRGAIDNHPDVESEPEKLVPYFGNALKEVSEGKPLSNSETKPYGCSIKYKE